MNAHKPKLVFVILLAAWLVVTTAFSLVVNWPDPTARAVVGMACGLVVLWVFAGGVLMLWLRRLLIARVQRIGLPWPLKFILFATLLALIEEAITTTMTNLAPLFGVPVGQAYITASADYLDVILHHSVIVFIPMFIAWAWLLKRYAFSPFQVFLLFGLTGMLSEAVTFGAGQLLGFAQWILVYGLMVYLPASSLPPDRGADPPRPWHFLLALLVPIFFAVPVVLLHGLLFPGHPSIHFPAL
ncbi:MAG: hypothetical protein JW726_16760 [Anaerolineales bacterium]|nr:hypothetical protein [Anaerolineales bacterium]